jgi:hypothetical protein
MIRNSKRPERLRLLRTVREAKGLGTYPEVVWESCRWEIKQYDRNRRAHQSGSCSLRFTQRRKRRTDPGVPFASIYGDFVKALIRMRASNRTLGTDNQDAMLRALQFLYDTLQNPLDRCDPTRLTRRHFHLAMERIQRQFAVGTAYNLGHKLREVAEFLNVHQLCRTRIRFQNVIARPLKGDRLDPVSQAEGMRKMPSAEVLNALADISSQATDDGECIVLRIIDLLVVGGFRVGEVLTLPRDCWVEETALDPQGRVIADTATGEPVKRCGLRYWPEKGGDPIVKWLPSCAVPLARRAVDGLVRLCAAARQAATVLEKNPDRVPLPGNPDPNALLSIRQLMEILPFEPQQSAIRIFLHKTLELQPATRASLHGEHNPSCLYRVSDIERALCKRRGQLEVLRFSSGGAQRLSDSLCVTFHNQLCSSRATLTFLPELVNAGVLNGLLGGRRKNTVFSRHGFTHRDGSPMRIHTHAFRHWLNTLADQGGLSDVELARWMGRRDIQQNQAYKHGTVEQRVAWAQEMLLAGKLHGATASAYHGIEDPVEKRVFLRTFVGVAHFTPYGVCTHDFAITPCPYHLNCLSGCSEYLRTQGDAEERHNLIQLRDFTAGELSKAEHACEGGLCGASNWVDFNRRTLAGIEAALAVDEKDHGATAATVAVFAGRRAVGTPVE